MKQFLPLALLEKKNARMDGWPQKGAHFIRPFRHGTGWRAEGEIEAQKIRFFLFASQRNDATAAMNEAKKKTRCVHTTTPSISSNAKKSTRITETAPETHGAPPIQS